MKWIKNVWGRVAPVAKAAIAAAGTAATYLIAVGALNIEINPVAMVGDLFANLAEFTTKEWLQLIGATGVFGGLTWWIPNRPTT